MTRNTILAVAVTAASAIALSGCLDTTDPLGPVQQCTLNPAAEPSVAGDTLTLEPGLRYIQRTAGQGPTAKTGSTLDVCYVGRFTNGEAFDANILPSGGLPPVTIGRGDYLPGFERGFVDMGVGGVRRLIISPALAYGDREVRGGNVVIPPNSTLVFDVQVLRIR
ncbi:MAG TPA: FKBP-type peptidyl-prolyl cis-trans isomerase [Longimicrobiaceae bacterium]|nr:FKBP-type peptidyl-prolyl cis-trans isomerase [Longimicrobiaceae bacterium]